MPPASRGSRRDFAALEARRYEAARLFARGETQASVARTLGATRAAAHRWYHAWQDEGRTALKAAGRAGRKPRLEAPQLARVETALLKGPGAHGFATELWTLPRVATLLEQRPRVRYHPGHVWYILRRLGWSLQRPTRHRRERDEASIAEWKLRRWPQVKKSPAAPGLDRLRRRKRRLAPAGRPPHLGPARPPAGLDSYGRELDTLVDRGGSGLPLGRPAPALLLPDAARELQRSRADRLSARAQAALSGGPHHSGVGRAAWAQEPRDATVSRRRSGLADGRALAWLCPRIESRRADLGQHQRPRTGQPLPGRHPCAPRAAARRLRSNPSPIDAGLRLLAARGTVLLTWPLLYFTRLISQGAGCPFRHCPPTERAYNSCRDHHCSKCQILAKESARSPPDAPSCLLEWYRRCRY